MTRVAGAGVAGALLALIAALVVGSLQVAAVPSNYQDAAASVVEVGAGPIGDRAFAFVGRTIYGADSIQLYGYLTGVLGLDPTFSYTSGTPSEQTARFTYSGDVAIASETNRGDVTETTGQGTLRIFMDEGGAAVWDDPGSFADGQLVAEYALALRDTEQRQAPGIGVVVGDEQLEQVAAEEFEVEGQRFRFGAIGIAGRLRYTGALIGDAGEQGAAVSLTGAASVTGREATTVRLALSPAAGTPAAVARDCPDLQPWLGLTTGTLAEARSLTAQVDATAPAEDLDPTAIGQKAAAFSDLASALRESEAPEASAEANQLVVTALSTLARGAQTMATATADGDVELLEQGQATVGDGNGLLNRAEDAVDALVAGC